MNDEERQISPAPTPSATVREHQPNEEKAVAKARGGVPQVAIGLDLTPIPDSTYLLLAFSTEPSHPEDPLNFSRGLKVYMTGLAAILVMNTALASSTPSGGAPYISARFGGNTALVLSMYLLGYTAGPFVGAPLSEAFGRRPVFLWGGIVYTCFSAACIGAPNLGGLLVLRFFAGFFGSAPTTNSGAVCGDIWNARERGTAMSLYSVATFAGPSLGPIIGSFAAARLGWRYDFVILTAFSAFLCLVIFFACPETYPEAILTKIARDLRASTGDARIVCRVEFAEIATRGIPRAARIKAETRRLVGTPFAMLLSDPIVIFTSMFSSMVYGLIYLVFEAYPVIFDGVHNLGPGYSSLPFLGVLVGACLSVPLTLWYQSMYLAEVDAAGGQHQPEMRLPMAEVGGILMVVSFLFLGWTGYKNSIPWIVPCLAGIPQGIASVLVFRSIQTYLIDTYERQAASATAANVITRSIAGAVFPLFGRVMLERLGVNWGCTLLAGLMLLLTPVPFFFRTHGAKLRKRSKFTSGR